MPANGDGRIASDCFCGGSRGHDRRGSIAARLERDDQLVAGPHFHDIAARQACVAEGDGRLVVDMAAIVGGLGAAVRVEIAEAVVSHGGLADRERPTTGGVSVLAKQSPHVFCFSRGSLCSNAFEAMAQSARGRMAGIRRLARSVLTSGHRHRRGALSSRWAHPTPENLMPHEVNTAAEPRRRSGREPYLPPELAIDLEADNILLRAALASSASADVRRDLITQELKHRIGNLLAVVQAIARHTFRNADAASVEDFNARLLALAVAQKLLIDSETRAASMIDVVTSTLAPHCADGDRAKISGPEVALDGRRAHALTLALHELATNAAKYGALSTDAGWIEIVWTQEDGALTLVWREHGGPPVSAPKRRGFGSTLISRNLGLAFRGQTDMDFDTDGLVCRLVAPAI
ncbi:MAG: hypothetical protein B7Y90_10850 [Alphaproteobacteria bacterium 32-64-14]|nr:MAG: hypothetical protein B7Y90_10850 [Alphaproteobacteria bacterium 32-64-14]